MVLDCVGDTERPVAQRWLYRGDDRSPFAFARGDEFIRYADHTRWARLCDNRLLSIRSGTCLAYRIGSTFFDAESNNPVYYQSATVALPDHRPFGEVRAVRVTHEANPHRTADTEPRQDGRRERPRLHTVGRGPAGDA